MRASSALTGSLLRSSGTSSPRKALARTSGVSRWARAAVRRASIRSVRGKKGFYAADDFVWLIVWGYGDRESVGGNTLDQESSGVPMQPVILLADTDVRKMSSHPGNSPG